MIKKKFSITPVKAKVIVKKNKITTPKKMGKKEFTLQEEFKQEFGLTMNLNDLSEIFHLQNRHIQNMIYNETFPIKTFCLKKKGGERGTVVALTVNVVRYIEKSQ